MAPRTSPSIQQTALAKEEASLWKSKFSLSVALKAGMDTDAQFSKIRIILFPRVVETQDHAQ